MPHTQPCKPGERASIQVGSLHATRVPPLKQREVMRMIKSYEKYAEKKHGNELLSVLQTLALK